MKNKGTIPLGDFYIYPDSEQDVYGQEKSTTSNTMSNNTSLLCCSYNIYLASTNLIFQPHTRRMRIRPITSQTIRSRGKKGNQFRVSKSVHFSLTNFIFVVVISPSGETAYIATNSYTLPKQTEENILKQWSLLLDIPYTNLIQQSYSQKQEQHQKQRAKDESQQMQKDLPNLVAIKSSAVDETYYYPSRLIFISSSSRLSPTALSGMNGLFGFNQGFSEDLGDKWHRGAWNENISNYWEYACPRDITTNTILDTLSQDHSGSNSMINLLQKAINEPVIASPLMATKSVATPGSAYQRNDASSTMTPNSSIMDEDDGTPQQYQQPQQQLQQRNRAKYQSGLSLVDFAMTHFAMPPSEELPEYPEIISAPVIQNSVATDAVPNAGGKTNLVNGNNISTIPTHPTDTHNNSIAGNSTYRSPQMSNLELDAFGIVENMDVDSMVMDMPNRWIDDGMGDLDSLDFGVTEEDFDFFESVPTPAVPVAVSAPLPATQQVLPSTLDTKSELGHEFSNDMLLGDLIKQEVTADDFASAFDQKEILSLDEKQQQRILDTDMDISSLDNSVTPLQVGMAVAFNNSHLQQQQQLQQQQLQIQQQQQQQQQEVLIWNRQNHSDQQHLFVPPQFAPVQMDFAVNDAKYNDGGKFTYTPAPKSKRKGSDYQPDYVPIIRKKKSERRKSSKMLIDTIEKDNKALTLIEHEEGTPHISTVSSSQTSSETEDSSSEESTSDQSEDENLRIHRTVRAVSRAQDKYLKKVTLLKPWRIVGDISIDQLVMDYDSPFARTIASSTIHKGSRKEMNENEDIKALDYLCQQAVMGGYPFSGGIESKSSNGFEANEGESTKVLVARRRNLLQKFNGGR